MIKPKYSYVFLISILLILCLGLLSGSPQQENPMFDPTQSRGNFAEDWAQFDKLLQEQKHEATSSLVQTMLEQARAAGNNAEWVWD